jgi:hypothetical protein
MTEIFEREPEYGNSAGRVNLTGYSGVKWRELRVDRTTRALMTIDYAHYEVHAGSHFMYTDHTELGSGATQNYLITVPDSAKCPHMIFDLDGYGVTQWQFFEGTDRVGITTQNVGNNNRNSATTAGVTIHKGVTGGTEDGGLAHIYKGGASGAQARTATQSGNAEELILKRNTKYILRTTSLSLGNLTNIRLEWYEHTDREA